MPSNDALGRTPQHIAFKRARTLYARTIRNYESIDFAMRVVEVYLQDFGFSPDLFQKIFNAACLQCLKPSAEK